MNNIETILDILSDKGVILIDPRQIYVSPDVDLNRIYPGCVLHPGVRLTGSRTLIGTGARIGVEGPATINDTVIGAEASIASGYITQSTLLPRAKAGGNSHFRFGTLLEEEANTAHAVGLKQTIMMYGVTIGSLVNFCDALLSGGFSRRVHTEVGSGFIHFNYTPWGESGDKATPSLLGTVTEGVFLDRPPIFLGGMSGIVGPKKIGFGAMTVAGQVIRESVPDDTIYMGENDYFSRAFPHDRMRPTEKHIHRICESNTDYLAQLYALKAWYIHIRKKRSMLGNNKELSLVYDGAIETIEECIKNRVERYNSFANQWGAKPIKDSCLNTVPPKLDSFTNWKIELKYDEWIWSLSSDDKALLHDWLINCANMIKNNL